MLEHTTHTMGRGAGHGLLAIHTHHKCVLTHAGAHHTHHGSWRRARPACTHACTPPLGRCITCSSQQRALSCVPSTKPRDLRIACSRTDQPHACIAKAGVLLTSPASLLCSFCAHKVQVQVRAPSAPAPAQAWACMCPSQSLKHAHTPPSPSFLHVTVDSGPRDPVGTGTHPYGAARAVHEGRFRVGGLGGLGGLQCCLWFGVWSE